MHAARLAAPRDLLRQPLWRPEDLGQPLPQSVHANSVCLPTWADVIAYEEGDPRVLGQLQTGYPRFFIHPLTERLFQACSRRFVRGDELCHVYPSRASAERCVPIPAAVERTGGAYRILGGGRSVCGVFPTHRRRGGPQALAA